MSTKAQEKQAHKVAAWFERMAAEFSSLHRTPVLVTTSDLAYMLREFARAIREGEHRR